MKIKRFFESSDIEDDTENLKQCFMDLLDSEKVIDITFLKLNPLDTMHIFKGNWWDLIKDALSISRYKKFQFVIEFLEGKDVVSEETVRLRYGENSSIYKIYSKISKILKEISICIIDWNPKDFHKSSFVKEASMCCKRAEIMGFLKIGKGIENGTFIDNFIETHLYFISKSKLEEILRD